MFSQIYISFYDGSLRGDENHELKLNNAVLSSKMHLILSVYLFLCRNLVKWLKPDNQEFRERQPPLFNTSNFKYCFFPEVKELQDKLNKENKSGEPEQRSIPLPSPPLPPPPPPPPPPPATTVKYVPHHHVK